MRMVVIVEQLLETSKSSVTQKERIDDLFGEGATNLKGSGVNFPEGISLLVFSENFVGMPGDGIVCEEGDGGISETEL